MDKDEARLKQHETMIEKHREANRVQHIKKLVANARAIITNQIGIPLGVLKMDNIMTWIRNIRPLTEIDIEIFSEYMRQASGLPIGTERLQYNKDYLKQQDVILDELTSNYKDRIIDKCFEIIEKFSNKEESQTTDAQQQ